MITPKKAKEWSAPYRNWHYHPDHVIPEKPEIPGHEDVHSIDCPTIKLQEVHAPAVLMQGALVLPVMP